MSNPPGPKSEAADRIQWARRQAGYESAAEAARALSMKDGTYRAYERPSGSSKHTPLDHQLAARLSRLYGVRWEWLLTGELPVKDDPREREAFEAFLAGRRSAER